MLNVVQSNMNYRFLQAKINRMMAFQEAHTDYDPGNIKTHQVENSLATSDYSLDLTEDHKRTCSNIEVSHDSTEHLTGPQKEDVVQSPLSSTKLNRAKFSKVTENICLQTVLKDYCKKTVTTEDIQDEKLCEKPRVVDIGREICEALLTTYVNDFDLTVKEAEKRLIQFLMFETIDVNICI